jgi:hypothetical protein
MHNSKPCYDRPRCVCDVTRSNVFAFDLLWLRCQPTEPNYHPQSNGGQNFRDKCDSDSSETIVPFDLDQVQTHC